MADRVVSYRLTADIAGFRASLAQASSSVKTAADQMTGASKEAQRFRQGLDGVGRAAGVVGVASGAAFAGMVLGAANFEEAMSSVEAATRGSAQNLDRLREAALRAGQETKFSATESAAAIENLAKAGVSTGDILGGGLDGALALAAAGSIDVATAAETAASAMTQFGLAGTDVPRIADLIAAAAGKAQGEVGDFAQALNQTGLVANQTGLTIEETTGALAAFASAGLLGSDAGTSFKTMLLSLVPKSEDAAKAMDRFGISAFDAQGNFIGLEEFAGRLRDGLKDLSVEQRQATLQTIFGTDAIRAANVLYRQGERGVRAWTQKVSDSGFAAETAATKLDNFKGDFEEFTGALETALIGAGTGSQGPLRSLTQGATDVVNAFNDLPESAKNAAGSLTGFVAVAGGTVYATTQLVQGAASARAALDSLGVSFEATSKKAALLRGGAGVLGGVGFGLTQLSDDSDAAGKAITTLGTTASGALLGFAAGGPIGAAIGGGAGLLYGLGDAFLFASDKTEIATEKAADYASTLDDVTGAATRLTRSKVLDVLTEQGVADNAAALGVPLRDLVDYVLGKEDAIKRVTKALNEAGKIRPGEIPQDAIGRRQNANVLQQALGIEKDQFTFQANAAREAANAVQTWSEALRGVPKEVRTELRNLNYEPTRKQIERLREEYDLTPKQVRTIIEATDNAKPKIEETTDLLKALDQARALPKIGTVGTIKTLADLAAIKARMAALDGTTATVTVSSRRIGGQQATPYATGGLVTGPGSATSDSIPALLSNGEYVMRAAAVQRYGTAFMGQLNSLQVGGGPSALDISPRAVAAIASAVSRARPLYGDVHVSGDGSFEAELRRKRGEGGGGVWF